MKAKLSNYRQSPRKTRLVADLLRKKKVEDALVVLKHVPKRASIQLLKLLNSAIANAKEKGLDKKDLFVKEIRVDEGVTLKRIRPVSRGSAHPIRKRTSRVLITLESVNKNK